LNFSAIFRAIFATLAGRSRPNLADCRIDSAKLAEETLRTAAQSSPDDADPVVDLARLLVGAYSDDGDRRFRFIVTGLKRGEVLGSNDNSGGHDRPEYAAETETPVRRRGCCRSVL
jgi:hypothetical protein